MFEEDYDEWDVLGTDKRLNDEPTLRSVCQEVPLYEGDEDEWVPDGFVEELIEHTEELFNLS